MPPTDGDAYDSAVYDDYTQDIASFHESNFSEIAPSETSYIPGETIGADLPAMDSHELELAARAVNGNRPEQAPPRAPVIIDLVTPVNRTPVPENREHPAPHDHQVQCGKAAHPVQPDLHRHQEHHILAVNHAQKDQVMDQLPVHQDLPEPMVQDPADHNLLNHLSPVKKADFDYHSNLLHSNLLDWELARATYLAEGLRAPGVKYRCRRAVSNGRHQWTALKKLVPEILIEEQVLGWQENKNEGVWNPHKWSIHNFMQRKNENGPLQPNHKRISKRKFNRIGKNVSSTSIANACPEVKQFVHFQVEREVLLKEKQKESRKRYLKNK